VFVLTFLSIWQHKTLDMVSVGWVIEPLLKYKQIEILNILTIWQQKNLDMVSFE
jgi:hypothetical protein